MRRNAQRRKMFNQGRADPATVVSLRDLTPLAEGYQVADEAITHEQAFADLTDMENERAFRYKY